MYYPKIPYFKIKERTPDQQFVYDMLGSNISMERMYELIQERRSKAEEPKNG